MNQPNYIASLSIPLQILINQQPYHTKNEHRWYQKHTAPPYPYKNRWWLKTPTYTSVKQLRDKLIINAVDIPSDLGNSSNGYLFLVVPVKEYTKSTTETKPTVSTKPTEPTPASARNNTRENTVDYNVVKE